MSARLFYRVGRFALSEVSMNVPIQGAVVALEQTVIRQAPSPTARVVRDLYAGFAADYLSLHKKKDGSRWARLAPKNPAVPEWVMLSDDVEAVEYCTAQ
jgi:hypothetical protein